MNKPDVALIYEEGMPSELYIDFEKADLAQHEWTPR